MCKELFEAFNVDQSTYNRYMLQHLSHHRLLYKVMNFTIKGRPNEGASMCPWVLTAMNIITMLLKTEYASIQYTVYARCLCFALRGTRQLFHATTVDVSSTYVGAETSQGVV